MKKYIFLAIALSTVPHSVFASNWTDDFDGYSLGDINGQGLWIASSTIDVVNTDSHSGKGLDIKTSASASGGVNRTGVELDDGTSAHLSFWLMTPTGHTSSAFMTFGADSLGLYAWYLNGGAACIVGTKSPSFDRLALYQANSSTFEYIASSTLAADTWYKVDIYFDFSSNKCQGSVDDGDVSALVPFGGSYVNSLNGVQVWSAASYELFIDDFQLLSGGSSGSCAYPVIDVLNPDPGETLSYGDGTYYPAANFCLPDNGRDWYIRHVDTYQEATTSILYPTGTVFSATSSSYIGDQEINWTYHSSYRPPGLYSSYYELLQYVEYMGTTTVMRGAAYNWAFGSSTSANGDFIWPSYYFPSYSASSTGCTWWFGMDVAKCVSSLIVPTPSMLSQLFNHMMTNVKNIPILNMPFVFYSTLTTQQSTGTLPSLVFTVPSGWPAAGATLDLTPWKYISGPDSYLSHVNDQGDSFWSVVMAPLRTLIWTGFAIWVVFRILSGGMFGDAADLIGSSREYMIDSFRRIRPQSRKYQKYNHK